MPGHGTTPSGAGNRATLAETFGDEALEDAVRLEPGATVGRYVLLHEIGAGAMGVVYAAFDPQLDRKVAIKVLQARERSSYGSASDGGRLLREAQSLAKLAHPNVVAIHDVGVHGRGDTSRVFIAMEHVAGETLATWIAHRHADWRATLQVLTAAGDGVAAAHAVGLIHRDLKPDNIMIGDDGRVRVMDFGLARGPRRRPDDAAVREQADDVQTEPSPTPVAVIPDAATIAGSLVGTPAYMAPEQFRSEPTDARTDQFNFCVTAWEALYGARPYGGDSIASLALAVCHGEVGVPPRDRGVPSWVRGVLARGLAADPAARHPSMQALVDALRRGQAAVRRRRFGLAGLSVVALGLGAFAWHHATVASARAACDTVGTSLADAWAARRTALRERILVSGVGHAQMTADKLQARLDAYARTWGDAATAVCRGGTVDETLAPEPYARAQWCLEEREVDFLTLVDALTEADAEAVHGALSAADALPGLDPCQDPRALAWAQVPDESAAPRVREIKRQVAQSRALAAADQAAAGRELAVRALDEAIALGWTPLVAQARLRSGLAARAVGEQAIAETELSDAYFEALRADALETAALAAGSLAHLVGYELSRPAEGEVWARLADAHARRLETTEGLRTAQRIELAGSLHFARSEYAEAEKLYADALQRLEAILGPDHPDVAGALLNVGSAAFSRGATDEALAAFERAHAMQVRAYGPDHPAVARALNNLAAVHRARGEHEAARASIEDALRIRESAYGPDHSKVIALVINLAILDAELGHAEAARAGFERALEHAERTVGPDSAEAGRARASLGSLEYDLGHHDVAVDQLQKAIAIYEGKLGPDHHEIAAPVVTLAHVHFDRAQWDEAVALYERALQIRERAHGPDHRDTASSRRLLAQALRERADATQDRDPVAAAADRAQADGLAPEPEPEPEARPEPQPEP